MTNETQQLSKEQQVLFDCVQDIIEYTDEVLIEELDDNGIETVEQFGDSFAGSYDGYGTTSAEAQFCEELISDCGYLENGIPSFISNHIDYQSIWDCELIHDYFTIEHRNTLLFFSRHF
jgi:hypothetical protein